MSGFTILRHSGKVLSLNWAIPGEIIQFQCNLNKLIAVNLVIFSKMRRQNKIICFTVWNNISWGISTGTLKDPVPKHFS